MLSAMRRVGVALRTCYHWVALTTVIYLIMDNAGGHGTNECVIEYTRIFKVEFNVVIIHQVPRSPYTNVLDLGVWRSLQSIVERKHFMRRCNADSLCRTVMEAWNGTALDAIIGKVFTRLEKVICLIKEEHGANDTVEEKRGIQYENMKFDDITNESESNTEDDIEDECKDSIV